MTENKDAHIERSFTYRAPWGNQPDRYVALREKAKELAYLIKTCCPPAAETTTAIRKLEETVMWANKSIACNEVEQ